MAGEISYRPTEADYVAAQRDWFAASIWRRAPRTLATTALAVSAMLGLLGLIAGDPVGRVLGTMATALVAAPVLVLCVWGLCYWLLPRNARRLFRQQRTLHRDFTYGWSEEGIHHRSDRGTGAIAWSDIHRWSEQRHTFLFYMNDRLFHFIPRRLLSDAEARDLSTTAAAHGPPRR
jgi:hypothetical protein